MEKSVYRDENLVFLKLLKQCRVEAGLTQEDFAKALDRPQSFVSDVERGLRRLDLIQLRDICQVLGISLSSFVQRFEEELAGKVGGEGACD
nr:helix-turn-helix transcriptional regulator [Pseudomonas toyotomiensis]